MTFYFTSSFVAVSDFTEVYFLSVLSCVCLQHQAEKSINENGATTEKPLDIPKELWMMVDHLFRNAVKQVRRLKNDASDGSVIKSLRSFFSFIEKSLTFLQGLFVKLLTIFFHSIS